MADGSSKPIEALKVGDMVLSRDPTTGQTIGQRVYSTPVRVVRGSIVLRFSNGECIETTHEHRFYVPGKGFVGCSHCGAVPLESRPKLLQYYLLEEGEIVRSLRIVLVLTFLYVFLAWGILWRMPRGNLAAYLGALSCWFALLIVSAWYEFVVGKRTPGDLPTPGHVLARDRHLFWPTLALSQLLPGLWIGFTARSPLLMAAAYQLTTALVMWVPFLLPPPPREPDVRFPWEPWRVCRALAILAGGTVVGYLIRAR
jgi:hypothetical protein